MTQKGLSAYIAVIAVTAVTRSGKPASVSRAYLHCKSANLHSGRFSVRTGSGQRHEQAALPVFGPQLLTKQCRYAPWQCKFAPSDDAVQIIAHWKLQRDDTKGAQLLYSGIAVIAVTAVTTLGSCHSHSFEGNPCRAAAESISPQ